MAEAKEAKKPFHELVAEKLIEQLKQGTAPWQRPWNPGEPSAFVPTNPTTGKRYRGINAVFLMSQGRSDQRWLTYKQAVAIGAQVKKGERGTPIQYWKFAEEQQKVDGQGKPIIDAQGQPVMQRVELERPRVFFATVFNAEQIDGMPPLQRKATEQAWSAVERAEAILAASGAVIRHGEQDRAFYRPATDSMHLPDRAQFPTAPKYYAIALHELGHWTGHESRLNRDLTNPFGSIGYAKEELRAEIASMILGDELGIGHDPEQHAAYVKSWIQVLQDDPMEIIRAAADAEKIQDFVLGLEQKQIQEQATRQEQRPTVADLTAAEYQAMKAADQAFHLELVRVYGEARAGDARYRLSHGDGAVQDAADAFKAASSGWHEAVTEARTTVESFAAAPQGRLKHAPAFFDSENVLRDAETAAVLPATWTGLAQQENKFWYVGQEAGDRSFTVLAATTLKDAQSEARVAAALHADIAEVLSDPDVSFEHFTAFSGESLEAALRDRGLTTVGSITGTEEKAFFERAIDRLSPVFGIAAEYEEVDNSYLERKGLAQAFQLAAENTLAASLVEIRASDPEGSDDNDVWKAARMERIREDLVRNDPASTDDEKAAAKEARKGAEMALMQSDSPEQGAPEAPARAFINVPFKEKNEAKGLGAKWDRAAQSWYVPAGVDPALFSRWETSSRSPAPDGLAFAQTSAQAPEQKPARKRQYLAVPYGERELAKQAGALWDRAAKSWYAGPKADAERIERWAPEKAGAEQAPALDPRAEFAEALSALGFIVEGDHPIMDGKTHRMPVQDDKKGERSGFYVGHLDGHPAGYMKNNRSGLDIKWKSKGYTLDPTQKAALQAEASAKLEARAAAQAQLHENTAQRLFGKLKDLKPVDQLTPYLAAKGIQPHPGAFTDREGKTTYIPAIDSQNRVWTMQYIQEDGTKRFAKDSRKDGCFHAVGGLDALAKAPVIVIAEGYATAATLAEVLGHATAAAFDSGNLPAVALALKERFPEKPFVIAGDDDRPQELTLGGNPGRAKAEAAAAAVGGKAMFPVFAPGEGSYPQDVPPITPKSFRAHSDANIELQKAVEHGLQMTDARKEELNALLLSPAQLAALAAMKKHTDFNDLANNSVFGREGVERQALAVVDGAMAKQLAGASHQKEEPLVQSQREKQDQALADDAPERRRRRALAKM